jgi:hypothetical protein
MTCAQPPGLSGFVVAETHDCPSSLRLFSCSNELFPATMASLLCTRHQLLKMKKGSGTSDGL